MLVMSSIFLLPVDLPATIYATDTDRTPVGTVVHVAYTPGCIHALAYGRSNNGHGGSECIHHYYILKSTVVSQLPIFRFAALDL